MTLPLSPTLNDDIYVIYPLRVYFIGQYPSINPKHIYDTLTKYWVYQLKPPTPTPTRFRMFYTITTKQLLMIEKIVYVVYVQC